MISVRCSLIPLAAWLGSGMEGPSCHRIPGGLCTARGRGGVFWDGVTFPYISLRGECDSHGGTHASGPSSPGLGGQHSVCKSTSDGRLAHCITPHSCPREAGRVGVGEVSASHTRRRLFPTHWTPCRAWLLAGHSPGSGTQARLWTPQQPCQHHAASPDCRLCSACSSGVFPALSFHRGQPRLQEGEQACPEPLAHGRSYCSAHPCCAGLSGHWGRTEAQGPSSSTPLPLHQETAAHTCLCPDPTHCSH